VAAFTIESETAEDELILRFRGDLNEDADFSGVQIPEVSKLSLDLRDVQMLNSLGLRAWVNWIRSVPDNILIVFSHCPHFVVEQMNILEGFLPMGARVESFFVPYHCEACGHDEMYLAVRGRDYMEGTVDKQEGVVLKETRSCPVCPEDMELDVIPHKYFRFLKYRGS